MKEYKVISKKDMALATGFDPLKLEKAINKYAAQGWVFKAIFKTEVTALFGGERDESYIILERDK